MLFKGRSRIFGGSWPVWAVLCIPVMIAAFVGRASSDAGPYIYRSDTGWCLSHSGENLAFFPVPDRPRGVPEFLAPSDLPLPLLSAPEGATGLVVSYRGDPTFSTREPERHVGRMGCERIPGDHGLSRLTGEGRENCSVRESRDWHSDWFEPTGNFDVLDGVFLRCGRDAAAVNCLMTGLLPNGWETEIVLPNTHIGEWQAAARTARHYFDSYLTDCGDN